MTSYNGFHASRDLDAVLEFSEVSRIIYKTIAQIVIDSNVHISM